MFLFRERRPSTTDLPRDLNAGRRSCPPVSANTDSPPRPRGGAREFLAVKAARFLGGAARQVTASLAGAAQRLAAGPTAESLRVDLEARASGMRDSLATDIAEWAQVLAAQDETARYETPGGGRPLTYRVVFLGSRAFELALAAVGCGRACVATAQTGGTEGLGQHTAAWRSFLDATVLPGGTDVAAEIPELLALTRHFPDCRQWVDEAALAIKADARTEQLRGERAVVGTRAEELRASLRRGATNAGTLQLDEACSLSREAVTLYAAFRDGLEEAALHLQGSILSARRNRLHMARDALGALGAEAEQHRAESAARREEVLHCRDSALAEPRRAVELLERDASRLEVDEHARYLEERRRELQMQVEQTSQALASKRDARLALLMRRESAVKEHRRRAEATERQLRELGPAQLHRVVGSRAGVMTEGEIVSGLARSSETAQGFVASAKAAAKATALSHGDELSKQLVAVEGEAATALQDHLRLELARLEAAGAAVCSSIAALLDGCRSRASIAAMGLPGSEATMPARHEVQRLRKMLAVVDSAWREADAFWGSATSVSDAAADVIMARVAETAPSAMSALEASRGRIAQAKEQLMHADPELYEFVLRDDQDEHTPQQFPRPALEDEDDDDEFEDGPGAQLPHGWEAHQTSEGDVYYHSHVTGITQWEAPEQDAAVCAGWRLFQADDGHWFYHNPYDGAGVWYPELPSYAAEPAPLEALLADAQRG